MTEDYNNPELPDVIVPTGDGKEIRVNDVPLDKQVKVTPDGKGGYTISFEDKPPPAGPGGDAPPPAPGAPAPAPGTPAPGAPAPGPEPAPPPGAPEAPPKVPPKAPPAPGAPAPAPEAPPAPGTPGAPKEPAPAPGTPGAPKEPAPAPGTPGAPKEPAPAPGAPGAPPPEAPAPGAPVPKGNMEYSSPYKEGDTVDKKFLDDAQAKGGIPGEDDKGTKTVTLNGVKYTEGDKLSQYGADKALEAGLEKPEKDMGYYHEGDRVTPEMIQDLKKQGFTEDDEGNLVSPDGETKIPMPDPNDYGPPEKLSKDDADALTKAGIHKSSAYLRNHPESINNPDNSNFIGDEPDITETQAKDMKYDGDLNGVDGHKPKIVEGKGDYNAVVYEYDKELGGYKAVGEIYENNGQFYEYSDEQKYKVNVEHSLPAGNAWEDQDD